MLMINLVLQPKRKSFFRIFLSTCILERFLIHPCHNRLTVVSKVQTSETVLSHQLLKVLFSLRHLA